MERKDFTKIEIWLKNGREILFHKYNHSQPYYSANSFSSIAVHNYNQRSKLGVHK